MYNKWNNSIVDKKKKISSELNNFDLPLSAKQGAK